ncbi:MAG: exodeoxyribonuclease V subunit alpha [Vulcanococcus sp.]
MNPLATSLASALADSLQRLLPANGAPDPLLLAAVGALSDALERGELALDLEGDAPEAVPAEAWPQPLLEALEASGWVVAADALERRPEAPIVHDGRWLRWRRWHLQLRQCLDQLLERAQGQPQPPVAAAALQAAQRQARQAGLDPQQAQAVAAVLEHRLVLLLGGPGTGKTSTVVQLLAAALRQWPAGRIQLAAPTGKAATRLAEAVAGAAGAGQLEPALQARLAAIPCGTLHRLLEAQGEGRFRRGARLPLELDLLVVDETSMVDLPLMAALLAALPPQATLVLVGDAGQLPPVGPGAVLEELCRPERLQQLGGAAVELRTAYRNDGAIAQLAAQLRPQRSGDPLTSLRPTLEALPEQANLRWLEAPPQRLPAAVLEPLRQHQRRLAQLADDPATNPAALLQELEQLIALSPVRQGPWGVEALHRALLGPLLQAPLARWPLGTPVLNRQNRPEQGLANGDIGVLIQRDGERRVLMAGDRLLHPTRLGEAEPALALTVHKAQGSQYQRVLLLVPPSRHGDPRLLYTGLTRARRGVLLVTPEQAP